MNNVEHYYGMGLCPENPYTMPVDICGGNIGARRIVKFNSYFGQNIIEYDERGCVTLESIAHSLLIFFLQDEIEHRDIVPFIRSLGKHMPRNPDLKEKLSNASPIDICVVCNENQGRSQIAERVIREMVSYLGLNITLRSRGDKATPDKHGGGPSKMVKGKMNEHDISIDGATVDQFKSEDIHDNTLLIIMDDAITLEEWANKAKYILRWGVPDVFPGDIPPVDLSDRLDLLLKRVGEMTIFLCINIARSIEKDDFSILERYIKSCNARHNASIT